MNPAPPPPPNPVDKRRVRRAFSRAAAAYDGRDSVQAAVREAVLARVAALSPPPHRVLDVGAGTGALLARLAAAPGSFRLAAVDLAPAMCASVRRAAPAVGVAAADAEALPFAGGAFDLVVSTSALQWLPRLGAALAEIVRVLAPGGVACLALFGERTLHELRGAWAEAGGQRPAHRFASRVEVEAALAAAGLSADEVEEEERVEHHPEARAVLRALKVMGAQAASPGRGGLAGAGAIREMLRRYDALRGSAGVPATFHVVRALARRVR